MEGRATWLNMLATPHDMLTGAETRPDQESEREGGRKGKRGGGGGGQGSWHLNTFAISRATLQDVLAGAIAADKGNGFDVGVVQNAVHRRRLAMHCTPQRRCSGGGRASPF